MANKLCCPFSGPVPSVLFIPWPGEGQMGEVSQWDFCGSRRPGRCSCGRAAVLKVVLELRVKEERENTAESIMLIREVR